jgi:hypothetical protein
MSRLVPRQALVLGVLAVLAAAPNVNAANPSQFIAKVYTESLGRIPDQSGWASAVSTFDTAGCNASSLKNWARVKFLSTEYNSLGYDNAARLLTLYRGVLSREPDPGGFSDWLNALNAGMAWSSVVDGFFVSSEFSQLVPRICGSAPYYGWDTLPVMDLPVTGSGFQGSQSQLQTLINATPSGSTVWLAQKAVIRLSSPLTIKAGVTVATTGLPPRTRYALFARLVRTSNFNEAAVRLSAGAKLKHVWVDGQRGTPLNANLTSINVQMRGGAGTAVLNSRIDNTAGWSSLTALGSTEGFPCSSNVISGNLITVYSSDHYLLVSPTHGAFADGIGISCESTTVENNQIVDASDVAIVLFRAAPAIQRSQIRNNYILNAGNSAFGALVADPLNETPGAQKDFTGAVITDNTFWTGRAHYDVGLGVGTRAWFGSNAAIGTGAHFTNNSTGTQYVNVNSGIVVGGMLNTFVQGNNLVTRLQQTTFCPVLNLAAAVSAGYASGSIQGPFIDIDLSRCVGH